MGAYRIDIMTLFPDSVGAVLGESILGRAQARGLLEIHCVQIRDFTENRQKQVDDAPYGGGWGCVLMAQPLKSCLDSIMSTASRRKSRVIALSPQGKPFTQGDALRLRDEYDHLVLVCGHYEGIDERFLEACVDEEISVGDFVLTGGEIPAMAVADSVCRLIPGVLSDEECFTGESHWEGLLEYPQYTRPEVWEGRAVPPELLSGDHEAVRLWRRKKSLERTLLKRPDLFDGFVPRSGEDRELVAEILDERGLAPLPCRFDQRRAEVSDLPKIMDIVGEARAYLAECEVPQWQNGYPDETVFRGDISRGECWVFLCRGEIAGTITVSAGPEKEYGDLLGGSWLEEGERYGVVRRIAVSAAFRRRGLAGEMLEFAEELCRGLGKTSVRAATHGENDAMRAFLKKHGYRRRGIVKLSVGGEDPFRVAYEKVL